MLTWKTRSMDHLEWGTRTNANRDLLKLSPVHTWSMWNNCIQFRSLRTRFQYRRLSPNFSRSKLQTSIIPSADHQAFGAVVENFDRRGTGNVTGDLLELKMGRIYGQASCRTQSANRINKFTMKLSLRLHLTVNFRLIDSDAPNSANVKPYYLYHQLTLETYRWQRLLIEIFSEMLTAILTTILVLKVIGDSIQIIVLQPC